MPARFGTVSYENANSVSPSPTVDQHSASCRRVPGSPLSVSFEVEVRLISNLLVETDVAFDLTEFHRPIALTSMGGLHSSSTLLSRGLTSADDCCTCYTWSCSLMELSWRTERDYVDNYALVNRAFE
ncbi:hypothetical protein Tcan_00518, partial [Toxocara canis]